MPWMAGHGWCRHARQSALEALRDAQPAMSRAPLLALAYIAWSLLYLAISPATRLELAARAYSDLRLARC